MMRRMHTFALPVRRRASGFVLLEVIVAMVIMGIAMATMMRSFTLSMAAIRKNDATTQATILAETALQALEAEPPKRRGVTEGSFEADGFPEYSFRVEMEEEKLKYRLKTRTRVDDFRDLKIVKLDIIHEGSTGKVTNAVDAYLVLTPFERFSYESKLRNELFSEEDGI